MDLRGTIEALKEQKQRVERVIAELERLQSDGTGRTETPAVIPRKRRGRKSMGLEERQDVSKRMKEYWANRSKNREQ